MPWWLAIVTRWFRLVGGFIHAVYVASTRAASHLLWGLAVVAKRCRPPLIERELCCFVPEVGRRLKPVVAARVLLSVGRESRHSPFQLDIRPQ